jgi:hypothetical protein
MHHTISFIHDDVAALRKNEDVPFEDILKATRRSDNDLCTLTEVELLFFNCPLGTTLSLENDEGRHYIHRQQ